MLHDECGSGSHAAVAWRVGTMVRGFGMLRLGVMPAQYRGGHFTTRKQGRVEQENHPSHHHSYTREPAQTLWPTVF